LRKNLCNQVVIMKSEGLSGAPRDTSDFESEVGSRLREVEKKFKNREEAAQAAGVAKSTFQRWVEGKADPSFKGLTLLARATGVSLDWLATGEGEMRPADAGSAPTPDAPPLVQLDARLVGRLTEKILLVYKEMGQSIAIHQAAERAAAESIGIVAKEADPDERLIMVGEVVAKLRQELQAAADNPASSKHRA
jgi:transcriptional regulator with XRE-family HTH domain